MKRVKFTPEYINIRQAFRAHYPNLDFNQARFAAVGEVPTFRGKPDPDFEPARDSELQCVLVDAWFATVNLYENAQHAKAEQEAEYRVHLERIDALSSHAGLPPDLCNVIGLLIENGATSISQRSDGIRLSTPQSRPQSSNEGVHG